MTNPTVNPRPGAVVLIPVGLVVAASAVASALIIGPLHTAMKLPPFLTWVTWFEPAAMQVASGLAAFGYAGTRDDGRYRSTRNGMYVIAAMLAVLAVCTVAERHGGFDLSAAVVAVLLCVAGPVTLALVLYPPRRSA